jgi:hypothetical protein
LQWKKLKLYFFRTGSVLVFVTKKANCEELAHNLQTKEFDVRLIHGDLNQVRRRHSETRDRCYDLKKKFVEKFGEKLAFLTQNKAKLCRHFDHDIGL